VKMVLDLKTFMLQLRLVIEKKFRKKTG